VVLEIGSGCGPCGILAAKLGAQQVMLTDYVDAILRNLRDCMHLNSGAASSGSSGRSSDFVESLAPANGQAAGAAVEAAAALAEAEEAADAGEWDPEDASECGSDDFDALLSEAAGAAGNGSSGWQSPENASWDAGPMHARFYDWQESVLQLGEGERAALAAATSASGADAAAAAAPGGSIDTGSNESGAPGMDAEEQYEVIIGTDVMYECGSECGRCCNLLRLSHRWPLPAAGI
jgi:hypothetical protein